MIFLKKLILAALFMLLPLPIVFSAQVRESSALVLPRWGIKTNLLWDATATVNLSVELRTSRRTSVDLPFNYNVWSFSDTRKWKHFMVQPELRWWPKEAFRGHFFGLHGHYAVYNIGGLPKPPFSQHMNTHRFEGWLAGAGVSYGYRWNFNRRWALEATLGAGYAYLSYDKFNCGRCRELVGSGQKHYVGPTRAGVALIFGLGGKRTSRPPAAPPYVALPAPAPKPKPVAPVVAYEPKLQASFIVPVAEAVKVRKASGKAYLDFAVGRSEIVPDFRNNAAELRKIYTLIELVKSNPYATITGITITGYASPEGTWASNRSLSERRAQALRRHLHFVYGLRDELLTVRGAGEDWTGLDSLVANSDMPGKYRMLEIIRGTDVFDGRERKLMTFDDGDSYRRIKSEFFPQLRRSDYSIGYTVAPFTVEQSKEVFRSRPDNLSLNEMFLISKTYEPGSDAFNEVFETAARLFPTSDVANLNAAASALRRRDTVSAARYLQRVVEHNAVYWNNAGVLAWFEGKRVRATEYFVRGGAQGEANIAELDKYLQSVKDK